MARNVSDPWFQGRIDRYFPEFINLYDFEPVLYVIHSKNGKKHV